MVDVEKVIKGLETCLKPGLNHCTSECPYFYKDEYRYECDRMKKDAIELLKEQEAIKPIYNEQKYGSHLPHCGNCEKVLPNDVVYGKVNFCHYCGKAVKWDE